MSKRLILHIVWAIALLASGLSIVRDVAEARNLGVMQQRNLERARFYERLLPDNYDCRMIGPGRTLNRSLSFETENIWGAGGQTEVLWVDRKPARRYTHVRRMWVVAVWWQIEVWEDRRDRLGPYTQNVVFDCQ